MDWTRVFTGNRPPRRTVLVIIAAISTSFSVLLLSSLAPDSPALGQSPAAISGTVSVQGVKPARDEDWKTEYLDAILAVRIVDGLDQAIAHIETFGSHHTDSIVTGDEAAAATFLDRVDSAIVLHNASTQFADGGEFGMGAEIGIYTNRLHARGPVGVEQLTIYKYVVFGTGQTRP